MNQLHALFVAAVRNIKKTEEDRIAGLLTMVQASIAREGWLATSLDLLAQIRGVTDLQKPLQIDSRGDFSLVSKVGFTKSFCEDINPNRPRTGVESGAIMQPNKGGWCYMNHFQVERMVTIACNDILCRDFDIACYRVGDVYPESSDAEKDKFFVATLVGDFPENDDEIPLADSIPDAEALAVKYLNLYKVYADKVAQV